jgi:hypothetical protein
MGIHISLGNLLHFLDWTHAATLFEDAVIGLCLQVQMNRLAAHRLNQDGIYP